MFPKIKMPATQLIAQAPIGTITCIICTNINTIGAHMPNPTINFCRVSTDEK